MLQFFGWGFINILSIFLLKDLSTQFLLYSILVGTFIGIFSTSLLRSYLKRHIFFDNFRSKEIIKIVVSTVLCAFLYGVLNLAFGHLYGQFGNLENETELKILEVYNSFWLLIFNSLFIIFGWVVCYLVIKLLLRLNANRIERLELNASLKQAQLNTLKGQINPHFMFNSLNNIRGLMLEDVDKSREMLTKLSEMLRYSLTKNNVDAIALKEELEMVENYIDLSRIQFEDRLDYVEDIDPSCLEIMIPPMLIQLLVENAAKHGIGNLKEGGTIHLSAHLKNSDLEIVVKNSGELQIDQNSTQLGLKNIRQRLRLLYGEKAHFELRQLADEVMALIKIPVG